MNLFSLGVEDENILVRGPIKSMKIEPTQILMIPQEVDFQMLFLNYIFKNTRLKDSVLLFHVYIFIYIK